MVDIYEEYTYNIRVFRNSKLKVYFNKTIGVDMTIGNKIKNLRNLCQLTQEELADRCELTKGYISQLENDLTSPSISTLTDILAALGSNLHDFFQEEEDPQIVFTKDDYFEKTTDNVKTIWLVPNAQKVVSQLFMVVIGIFVKKEILSTLQQIKIIIFIIIHQKLQK